MSSDPTLSLIDISSNNSMKTNYAGENDIVSLNITASEDINQPYVVFLSDGAAITNAITYSGSFILTVKGPTSPNGHRQIVVPQAPVSLPTSCFFTTNQ